MHRKILYLGDTALDQQAGYLAGILSYYDLDFDYLSSDTKFSDSYLETDYRLMIISDYPASNFTADQMKTVAQKTAGEMGLLMIGGWESFTGLGGDYCNTPIEDVLPVRMKQQDDRMNLSGPCLVIKQQNHEILDSLPFNEDLPAIGGLNSFDAKPDSQVLLLAVEYKAAGENGKVVFSRNSEYPLLVVNTAGSSRTAAFASDVAPHWVGPFVDWGDARIRSQAQRAGNIEVGNWYAQFFAGLVKWLCG